MKRIILEKHTLVLLIAVASSMAISLGSEGVPPIADAGLPRYAAQDPIVLDGTDSYDPDNSGTLSYVWRQISGPSAVIADANAATPTISGFVQTDEIRECEFELVVSDGELTSLPDTVKVIIVPAFGNSRLRLDNDSFDPNKPTFAFFGGGNCVTGSSGGSILSDDTWNSKANIINFPNGYFPDAGTSPRTYFRNADMIIVYLSSVAPDYKQPIQITGVSTGGQPAIDVGIHLNQTYKDARYAVNRVTFFDAVCRNYSESINVFLASSVDGEQCWVDNYASSRADFYPNVLNVGYDKSTDESIPEMDRHRLAAYWYFYSLADMNQFNHGVVAGAYWSVAGPGKNLQLASTPDAEIYKFRWYGWYGLAISGYMDFYNGSLHPGKLPEPVTLVGPVDVGDPNGGVLTCEECENAVGYQLLFGPDPYRVMDYSVISDTPSPPDDIITALPFDTCWWTVRVYDQYGSTIYADPIRIDVSKLSFPIENLTTGRRHGYLQDAIDQAAPGDEIVVKEGIHHETVNFLGKNLTLRSTDPNNPTVVAATIINGGRQGAVITMSGSPDGGYVLAGLTITGGTVGLACRDAVPTIRNCTIGGGGPTAIEFWRGYEPVVIDCILMGGVEGISDPTLVAHWALDEADGTVAYDSAGDNDATVIGIPAWQPAGGAVDGALEFDGTYFVAAPFVLSPSDGPFSVLAWVKGGAPGQVIVSQQGGANWLIADSLDGSLMTDLRAGDRSPVSLGSQTVITDGNWHRVAFAWDGVNRRLYVDDVLVAEDTQAALGGSAGKQLIGCGANMSPDTFFSGLIDDIRIYNRAVKP